MVDYMCFSVDSLIEGNETMKTNYTTEERVASAETTLYQYACEWMDTAEAKARCLDHGFQIDFRQADLGAYFEALDLVTNEFIELEV